MFTIQNQHLTLTERIDISYTAFIGCSSDNGGGIFSEINAIHLLKFCTFSLCSATTNSESRGGAFWIKLGNVTVKGCCSDSCKSGHGSDMLISRCEALELILSTSVNGNSQNHGVYISSEKKTEARYMNVSGYSISQRNYYGSGFNVGNFGIIRTLYFNLVKCVGSNCVFCCDYLENSNVEIKNINAVQNTGVDYFISLRHSLNSVISVTSSLFLQTSCSSVYGLYNTQTTSINFTSCSFSISRPSDTSVYSSCSFNDDSSLSVDKYGKCQINLINKFCSANIIRKHLFLNPFSFIPFII